jgi:tRNA(Ile)-lysidine synthase
MALRETFRAHLGTLALPSRRLLLAVSGGPDSVALLDLLSGCRSELGLELSVAHVDHGIHPDSASIADGVRVLAAHYGVPFLFRSLALGPGTSETAARTARYGALQALRREAGAELVATGHHADDQVETVLMRVLGGSGPAGLAGMNAVEGRLVRPLLPFRREDLARHVQSLGLEAWEDPANRDPRHLRSWLRTDLLPRLRQRIPDVDARLARVAEQGRINREGWAVLLRTLPGLDLELEAEAEAVSIAAPPLGLYDSKLALCLVMALGREAGVPLGPTRAQRVLSLVARGESGTSVPLGSGWIAEVVFGRLRFGPAAAEAPGETAHLGGESGTVAWGSWRFVWTRAPAPEVQPRNGRTAWFVPETLAIRGWRHGEKLRPLGARGHRLVVKCFQEARVPRSLRRSWPALEHAGLVVWLPGVCRSDLLVPAAGVEALRVDAELA